MPVRILERHQAVVRHCEKRSLASATDFFVALAFAYLAISFAASNPASAQARGGSATGVGTHAAGFGLGQTMLMGDFADNLDDALGFQLIYEYQASDLFGLYVTVFHSSHSNSAETNTLSLWTLTPHLRANLAYLDKLTLFGFTGFGLVSASEKLRGVEASATTVLYDLGAGFDLGLTDHFIFGTTFAFHNIFGKTDNSTVGGAFPNGISIGGTYLTLMLDVKYRF